MAKCKQFEKTKPGVRASRAIDWSQTPCTPSLTAISVNTRPIPLNKSDCAKIIAEKLRRFFQSGDHFDECGMVPSYGCCFRQSGRERQTQV
jgi:hypothetical protein